jgi:hypothetical protein
LRHWQTFEFADEASESFYPESFLHGGKDVGILHLNQEVWAKGDRRDLEQDDRESGIGDHDGLLEQVGTQDWQQGAMA